MRSKLLLLSFPFLCLIIFNCSAPDTPEVEENVTVDADFSESVDKNNIVVGDTIILDLVIGGGCFTDSLYASFIDSSFSIQIDSPSGKWFDTLHSALICSEPGRHYYFCSLFCNDREIVDSIKIDIIGKEPHCDLISEDMKVNVDDPASPTISATGSEPLRFYWYKGEKLVSDDIKSKSFYISRTSPSDEGRYFCVVENEWGTDTSTTLSLDINEPPSVKTPEHFECNEGEKATVTMNISDPDGDSLFPLSTNVDELSEYIESFSCLIENDTLSISFLTIQHPRHSDYSFSFEAVISDGALSDTITIPVTVHDKNIAPKWNSPAIDTIISHGSGFTLDLSPLLSETDDDAVEYTLLDGLPLHDYLSSSCYFLRPSYSVAGGYSIYIAATDNFNDTDTLIINLTIRGLTEETDTD